LTPPALISVVGKPVVGWNGEAETKVVFWWKMTREKVSRKKKMKDESSPAWAPEVARVAGNDLGRAGQSGNEHASVGINGRDRDGFPYPIHIIVENIYFHPHLQI